MCTIAQGYSSQKTTIIVYAYIFVGKPERTQILERMKPTNWIRAYDKEKEKEFLELFDSNRKPLFHDPKFFDPYIEKMIIGMKMKSIFYDLPYWEHINIFHLLDPMHTLKNVSSSLWMHISLKNK